MSKWCRIGGKKLLTAFVLTTRRRSQFRCSSVDHCTQLGDEVVADDGGHVFVDVAAAALAVHRSGCRGKKKATGR